MANIPCLFFYQFYSLIHFSLCTSFLFLNTSANLKRRKNDTPLVPPKCRSMRILQTQFANAHKEKEKGRTSRTGNVMTIDEDESDDASILETEPSVQKRGNIRTIGDTDEDLNEDHHYNRDEDMHTGSGTYADQMTWIFHQGSNIQTTLILKRYLLYSPFIICAISCLCWLTHASHSLCRLPTFWGV